MWMRGISLDSYSRTPPLSSHPSPHFKQFYVRILTKLAAIRFNPNNQTYQQQTTMQLLSVLVTVFSILSGVQAFEHRLLWGEENVDVSNWSGECPEPPPDAKYSKECYANTAPPPFVCKYMKPDDWVKAALDSFPRCCRDDLTECRCPVKNILPSFNSKLKEYCTRVEACDPPASDDAAEPSSTSGDAPLLRGVEGINEQVQRKELSP